MAVPVEPVEAEAAAEVTAAKEMAQEAVAVLVAVGNQLEVLWSIAHAARTTLDEAAGLLREDIHDTRILVADAFAVVPELNGPDPQATLAASAKLVAGVFSKAPVLPGAIDAAMDLVAGVYALQPSGTGALHDVQDLLVTVSDDHDHDRSRCLFANCTPYLGIDGEVWTGHRSKALLHRYAAQMRLSAAILEAQQTVHMHRFYQVGSPHLARCMKETWKLNGNLRTVIEEVDAALESIEQMRNSIEKEIQIVSNAIDANAG